MPSINKNVDPLVHLPICSTIPQEAQILELFLSSHLIPRGNIPLVWNRGLKLPLISAARTQSAKYCLLFFSQKRFCPLIGIFKNVFNFVNLLKNLFPQQNI